MRLAEQPAGGVPGGKWTFSRRGCFRLQSLRSSGSGFIVFCLIGGRKFPAPIAGTRQEMSGVGGCHEGQGIGVGALVKTQLGRDGGGAHPGWVGF